MTTCPTCGSECTIVGDGQGNEYHHPITGEVRDILHCRPGETVLEAAKRWRETVEWYGDLKNWTAPVDMENISESILNGEIATENDLGQRARELLGEEK